MAQQPYGWKRLRREMKAGRANPPKVEVGFKGQVATLARLHEFGLEDPDGRVTVPERAAFRAGLSTAERAVSSEVKRIAKSRTPFTGFTPADAAAIGGVVWDAIVESYRNFEGEPLSAVQTARKAGTPGAGRLLVGSRGERMISHISVWVDGQRVER